MGESSSKLNHSRWFSKNHRRVICIGLKGAGKSAITSYLTTKYPRTAKPLPEIGCYKFKVQKFKIAFYDLRGDEQSRFFWRHHFEGSQGVIFVCDMSEPQSFDNTKQTLQELLVDPLLQSLPFLILGNKIDLSEGYSKENIMQIFNIEPNPRSEVFTSCAITGEGVNEGVIWLLEKMNSV